MQKLSQQEGAASFPPVEEKVLVTHSWKCWKDRNVASCKPRWAVSGSPPQMSSGIEKLQSWQGTLPRSQVQCYAQIPVRDKDIAFRFECINRSLEIKNSGERGLNFVNLRVHIYSPMTMHIAYGCNSGGGTNIHIGRFAASSSDGDGAARPNGTMCWLLNSVGDKSMDIELSLRRYHVVS
jgi:hypothetical protein